MKKYYRVPFYFLVAIFCFTAVFSSPVWATDQYLNRQDLEDIIIKGEYKKFMDISLEEISVNFEAPLEIKGYLHTDKFVHRFEKLFSNFIVNEVKWRAVQIEERFAVESFDLVITNRRSEKTVYYKVILFLKRVDKEKKSNQKEKAGQKAKGEQKEKAGREVKEDQEAQKTKVEREAKEDAKEDAKEENKVKWKIHYLKGLKIIP